jgi:methylmalonyl-CoA mutase cobalamin-binding subunit
MLTKDQIQKCFIELNEELRKEGRKGEIGLVGGAVMCLVFNARISTRDVDAIFEPSAFLREAARKIAARHKLLLKCLRMPSPLYCIC